MKDHFFVLSSIILFSILLGALTSCSIYFLIKKILLKRRFNHAKRGEEQAEYYLKRHGFKILDRQVMKSGIIQVDGINHTYSVKADYLVKKGFKTAVVEVKTGEKAVDPSSSHTRRQLLEYAQVYQADEIYLFDAEHDRLKKIVFIHGKKQLKRHNIQTAIIIFLIILFMISLIICYYSGLSNLSK